MRPVVVAQQPASRRSSDAALDADSGDRLARLIGAVDRSDLLRGDGPHRVDAVNLVTRVEGWSTPEARAAADNLRPLLAGRRVVLLGRLVAAAFGFPHAPLTDFGAPLDLDDEGGATWVMPHPSGKCHHWNDRRTRARFRSWWRTEVNPPIKIGVGAGVVDLRAPDLRGVTMRDLAVALSRESRWSGHTREGYSVLQHQLVVALLLGEVLESRDPTPEEVLAALQHDLPEALGLRDLATPVKRLLGPSYRRLERRLGRACATRWGWSPLLRRALDASPVLGADRLALSAESGLLAFPTRYKDAVELRVRPWGLDRPELVEAWVDLVSGRPRLGDVRDAWARLDALYSGGGSLPSTP